jgi:hypothetical protein
MAWSAHFAIFRAAWAIETLAAFEAPAKPRSTRAQFFAGQLSVFVPIQFTEGGGGAIDFGFIKDAVVVGIQGHDQRRGEPAWPAFRAVTPLHAFPAFESFLSFWPFRTLGPFWPLGAFGTLGAFAEFAAFRSFRSISLMKHSRAASLWAPRSVVTASFVRTSVQRFHRFPEFPVVDHTVTVLIDCSEKGGARPWAGTLFARNVPWAQGPRAVLCLQIRHWQRKPQCH